MRATAQVNTHAQEAGPGERWCVRACVCARIRMRVHVCIRSGHGAIVVEHLGSGMENLIQPQVKPTNSVTERPVPLPGAGTGAREEPCSQETEPGSPGVTQPKKVSNHRSETSVRLFISPKEFVFITRDALRTFMTFNSILVPCAHYRYTRVLTHGTGVPSTPQDKHIQELMNPNTAPSVDTDKFIQPSRCSHKQTPASRPRPQDWLPSLFALGPSMA